VKEPVVRCMGGCGRWLAKLAPDGLSVRAINSFVGYSVGHRHHDASNRRRTFEPPERMLQLNCAKCGYQAAQVMNRPWVNSKYSGLYKYLDQLDEAEYDAMRSEMGDDEGDEGDGHDDDEVTEIDLF
jgi:hypothetical protein